MRGGKGGAIITAAVSEPLNIAAVATDTDGLLWIRATYADPGHRAWRCANRPYEGLVTWDEIAAVTVLSEGVEQ